MLTAPGSTDRVRSNLNRKGRYVTENKSGGRIGRPKLPDGEKVDAYLNVRVKLADKSEIDAAARTSGIPASEIIRSGALREARRLARKQRKSM